VVASDSLVVLLDQLSDEEPLQLSFDESSPAFNTVLRGAAESAGSAVSGSTQLQLESWPQRVDITGRIQVKAEATCVRCLTRFSMEFERKIVHILVRSLERPSGEEEVELSSNDLDRSLLEGNRIQLGEVLREELLLGMPMKAVCREDCEGICAGCGAELNDEKCLCKPQVDERWAALAALKTDKT